MRQVGKIKKTKEKQLQQEHICTTDNLNPAIGFSKMKQIRFD